MAEIASAVTYELLLIADSFLYNSNLLIDRYRYWIKKILHGEIRFIMFHGTKRSGTSCVFNKLKVEQNLDTTFSKSWITLTLSLSPKVKASCVSLSPSIRFSCDADSGFLKAKTDYYHLIVFTL
jgi:hypothetical protein